jgi:hypothetical protein
LTISQLAHNQIAHIPYCYNQEVNNLDFHQDEVIRNNLVNTLNKNYHSGLKQICVQKITDIIYQIDNFHSTKYQITRLQSANKLLLVFFEYTGFSSLLSLNKIIDYIKSKYEIEIIIITTPKAVSFISGINNVSYIFSINLNVTNIQTFYNQFSNVYNRSKIFTLVMQRFFAKEWIELIETLHNQFVGISAESIRLLYSDSFISIEKEDNEMFKKMTLNNSINVERFEAYLFVDNNVNLVGVYQVLNSLDTTGNNYSFKTTSILHSKRYIYDQIINRLNNIIGKYSAVGLYKILFSYSNGELYWEQTRHSFDLSLAKVLSETGCAYSLMLDIFINCIYNNAKIAQNSDIRYADNIYKYSSVICYSPYYMINGTMYNNFANSNIVQHSGTALKAINMMWQYMKYNNIDYQDGKKCIIINAEMKNIKYIPALYRNIKASNYYDVIYFTNQDVIHYLKQKYGINDIAIFLQEKNIDKIKETIKLVISLGKSDWLDEYVYKKYLPIARNYYEALFYIDAMITGSLNEKDRKVLL